MQVDPERNLPWALSKFHLSWERPRQWIARQARGPRKLCLDDGQVVRLMAARRAEDSGVAIEVSESAPGEVRFAVLLPADGLD